MSARSVRAERPVIWHDLECGSYTADLPLWRELAASDGAGAAILEIGAGSGRVSLDLARHGHHVIALERDRLLARELAERARDLGAGADGVGSIHVTCADACDFSLPHPVSLCIVPMHTVQLLDDRDAFLRCVRGALRHGGLLALSLLGEGVEPFAVDLDADEVDCAGVHYTSTPTALRLTPTAVVLERRRAARGEGGEDVSTDITTLMILDAATLTAEGEQVGFALRGTHTIAATAEHVGTDVLLLEVVSQ